MKPRVSIGIPVYNGAATLPGALDSWLQQTYDSFEVVVSDNASTDDTEQIVRDYHARDPRVQYFRNDENLGQIANFNLAFERARGKYFRWAGCNDSWEANYIERCAATLDENPGAILVTCQHKYHADDGSVIYEEYEGPRVSDPRPERRFARMLWFLHQSRYIFDPIYSMVHSDALRRTPLLQMMLGTDLLLAAELSLLGPFCHVQECLVHQHITPDVSDDEFLQRFDPTQTSARGWFGKLCRMMYASVGRSNLTESQKIYCYACIARYYARGKTQGVVRWGRRTFALRSRLRRLLGREVPTS